MHRHGIDFIRHSGVSKVWFFTIVLISTLLTIESSQDGSDPTSSKSNGTQRAAPDYPFRIVGGSEGTPHEFPYIVLLRFKDALTGETRICSGTILSQRWILTAGHCSISPVKSYQVVAGAHDKIHYSGTEQVSSVEALQAHPQFNPHTFQNDIGLLKLKTELKFNRFVKPVQIASSDFEPVTGTPTIVAGWGSREHLDRRGSSDVLRKVSTPIVDLRTCRRRYRNFIQIKASHICTGQDGKSSCQGDSGSPVLCRVSRSALALCGLVSGAKGCGEERFPQVNVNVLSYADWIRRTTAA